MRSVCLSGVCIPQSTHNAFPSDVQQNNIVAMMASLQRRLDQQIGEDREHQFFSRTLRYLSTTSGHYVQLEDWMLTSFDVEFGPEIGTGGLSEIVLFGILLDSWLTFPHYTSGQIFKGSWNGADVAIKVFHTEGGIAPSSAVRPVSYCH